ncbi:MAG: glycosyltransferase family 4 protein [Acidimicrobiia bacterium]
MKIGIVSPYDLSQPGGVQQLTTELAAKLREQGEEVVLLSPGRKTYTSGPGRDLATVPLGRPTFWRGNDSIVPITLSPLSWARTRRALAGVDVIHVHEPAVPLTGWFALTVSKPLVVTFHADPPRWVGPAYRWAPFFGSRMRNAVLTAVSEPAARAVPTAWGKPLIIPNAIDVASYDLPVGRDASRVAFLGRDEPRKGLDLLLEAWPRIREHHHEAELVVIGVDRESPPSGVRFLGRVSDAEKRRLLASSSVYVAPNTGGESFGIVIVEAMAAGCAVVASDLPAFRLVLGDNGALVPVGDVTALADAVSGLLGDSAETARLGTAAREAVKRFDWSNVLDAYRDCYRRALLKGI